MPMTSMQNQRGRTTNSIGYGLRAVATGLLFAVLLPITAFIDLGVLISHPYRILLFPLSRFLIHAIRPFSPCDYDDHLTVKKTTITAAMLCLLISTLILCGVAIGLTIAFGLPLIAIIVGASWAGVALIFAGGLGLEVLGEHLFFSTHVGGVGFDPESPSHANKSDVSSTQTPAPSPSEHVPTPISSSASSSIDHIRPPSNDEPPATSPNLIQGITN